MTYDLRTPEGDEAAETRPTRRGVLAASLFTMGYALAGPVNAQAITTDEEGLVISEPKFKGAAGYRLPAYVARPAAAGRHPCVIVVNEIFGIHAYIKDVCRRFAKLGYVAIAPDYFDRAGDPSMLDFTDTGAREKIFAIVGTATNEQVMADTDGAVAWLEKQSFADATRLAITGFCWGGAVTWMYAAHNPKVKAGAAWYGRLAPRPNQTEERKWPTEIAADLKAPVLGLYADLDAGIPLGEIDQMRAALQAAGNPTGSRILVFADTQHGFHADYRPSYNKDAAERAWMRAIDWFRTNGV